MSDIKPTSLATFAAGCFWGVESAFMQLNGVMSTHVGYTGGFVKEPTYQDVCADTTGHAEAVEVTFDPDTITYAELVETFFNMHDPTMLNRQGLDVGSQYRSVIYTHTPEQALIARDAKEAVKQSGRFNAPVVTEIEPVAMFWPAEAYHQQYFQKRGLEATCHL